MIAYLMRVSKGLYTSNSNCPWCTAIDNAFYKLEDDALYTEGGQKVISEVEKLLVNGYAYVQTIESAGSLTTTTCNEAHRMPMVNDDILKRFAKEIANEDVEYNPNKASYATAIFSRWCKGCGSRKHDIIYVHQWIRLYHGISIEKSMYLNTIVDPDKTVHITWSTLKDIGYCIPNASLKLERILDDVSEEIPLPDTGNTIDDILPQTGKVYVYVLSLLSELQTVLYSVSSTVWLPITEEDGMPKDLRGLQFQRSRQLVYENDKWITVDEFIAIPDIDPDDVNYGGLLLRWNADHVPDTELRPGDHDFDESLRLRITEEVPKRFFLKAMVYSQLFKQECINDHLNYTDLRFWNMSYPVQIVEWKKFEDAIIDLQFIDGSHSLTIEWSIVTPVPKNLSYFRIMLKQDDQYIVDGVNTTGYKVIDVPAQAGIIHYRVDIKGLAASLWWVCGIFPAFADSTPDIRIEYQHIVLVKPTDLVYEKQYNFADFYYTGIWRLLDDRSSWDISTSSSGLDHKVIGVDKLEIGQVAPLLIRQMEMSDIVEVEFDYKVMTRDNTTRLSLFANDKLVLSTSDTNGRWVHCKLIVCGTYGLVLHWEYARMPHESSLPWLYAALDNIIIRNLPVEDTREDNFKREDVIDILEEHYFNRKFKFDGTKPYVAEKVAATTVVIDPYYDFDSESEEETTPPPPAPGPWVNLPW